MCSIVFLIFFNKIYDTYRDLHMRIILNNALKVTLDIVENFFFFPKRAAVCINYEFIYNLRIVGSKFSMCYWKTELGESYQCLLELYYSSCLRNSIMITPTHRFFPCRIRLKKFSLQKLR